MRFQDQRESDNIEDRRGEGDSYGEGGGFGGFGPSFGPSPGAGFGGGGIIGLLVIIGLALVFGVDPRVILGGGGGGSPYPDQGYPTRHIPMPNDRTPHAYSADENNLKHFVSLVLRDTENVWTQVLPAQTGKAYIKPKLVLFHGSINAGCGHAVAQTGPFYCPNDQKVYIDLSFYQLLKTRFNAPGEFAQAYVVAHEIGHHIQYLLGTLQRAQQSQAMASSTERNAIQVKVELQADCFAGVWAKNTDQLNKTLEPGEIEQALRAASSIGDDAIQRQTRGTVMPDTFTHGTSEQRVRWFKRGYDGGTIGSCDTFGASNL